MEMEGEQSSSKNIADNFKTCSFCPIDKLENELYKCPRCQQFYCSVRCYKSKRHLQCSEDFYHKQCDEFTSEEKMSSGQDAKIKRPITTFEQYMEQHPLGAETELDEEKINPEIPIPIDKDEQILFDSDDEPEYLEKIVDLSTKQYKILDDDELNRKLMAAGLPIGGNESSSEADQEQLERLYQQLNEDEKKRFTTMANELFQEDFQSFTNCFKHKRK